jgi:hypothetical protein
MGMPLSHGTSVALLLTANFRRVFSWTYFAVMNASIFYITDVFVGMGGG